MHHAKKWGLWIPAVLGAGYGGMALFMSNANEFTLSALGFTAVIGAALFTCVASALCHCYGVWRTMMDASIDVDRDL